MEVRQRDTRHTSPSASIDDVVSKYLTLSILNVFSNIVKIQPQWLIVFGDGKIITAGADEIISSAINERIYGEQVENFGKRPLSAVLISDGNEKMSLREGTERITAIIHQLQSNGEKVGKLKDFLEEERHNLSRSR